jgi:hypothetical protein
MIKEQKSLTFPVTNNTYFSAEKLFTLSASALPRVFATGKARSAEKCKSIVIPLKNGIQSMAT